MGRQNQSVQRKRTDSIRMVQAEQLADQMTQQLRDKLNHEIEEYIKLRDNLKLYIFNTANRMMEKLSPTYAKQDKKSKLAQLERAYRDVNGNNYWPKILMK